LDTETDRPSAEPRPRLWNPRAASLLALTAVFDVAPDAVRGAFPALVAHTLQEAPESTPATPADVQIRDSYRERVSALRATMIGQCEKILASQREQQKAVSSATAERTAELKLDLEKCRLSSTRIPVSREFSRPAAAYEAEAAKARVACRAKVKKLATDAKAKKSFDESDRIISELDAYCPPTVTPTQFQARLAKLGEEFKSPKVKEGRANEDTIQVRDRLSTLLVSTGEARISAEDLTLEIKGLLAFVQDSEPLKKNGRAKEHKELLLDTEAALRGLLDEAAAR